MRYLSPKLQDEAPIIPEVFPGEASKKYLEILFINAEQFPFENEIAIYENKLAIMSLSRDEKIGLLIESKTISDTMKAVFNLAWIGATDFVAR